MIITKDYDAEETVQAFLGQHFGLAPGDLAYIVIATNWDPATGLQMSTNTSETEQAIALMHLALGLMTQHHLTGDIPVTADGRPS